MAAARWFVVLVVQVALVSAVEIGVTYADCGASLCPAAFSVAPPVSYQCNCANPREVADCKCGAPTTAALDGESPIETRPGACLEHPCSFASSSKSLLQRQFRPAQTPPLPLPPVEPFECRPNVHAVGPGDCRRVTNNDLCGQQNSGCAPASAAPAPCVAGTPGCLQPATVPPCACQLPPPNPCTCSNGAPATPPPADPCSYPGACQVFPQCVSSPVCAALQPQAVAPVAPVAAVPFPGAVAAAVAPLAGALPGVLQPLPAVAVAPLATAAPLTPAPTVAAPIATAAPLPTNAQPVPSGTEADEEPGCCGHALTAASLAAAEYVKKTASDSLALVLQEQDRLKKMKDELEQREEHLKLVEQKVLQEGKEVQDKKKEEQEQWTRLQEERAAVAKERANLEATENELKTLDGQIQGTVAKAQAAKSDDQAKADYERAAADKDRVAKLEALIHQLEANHAAPPAPQQQQSANEPPKTVPMPVAKKF